MTARALSFASAVRRRFLRASVPFFMLITLWSVLMLAAQPRAILGDGEEIQPLGSITPTERGGVRATNKLSFTAAFTTDLPIVLASPSNLKNLVTQTIFTLSRPLQSPQDSFCTWDWCTLSPRLYHEPLADGRTLIAWTDASGNGHVSVIANTNLSELASFAAQKILDYTLSVGAFDGGVFFVNQDGVIFKTQPETAELLGQDLSDTVHFQYINASPNYGSWTDLISLETSGKKIFCIGFAMTGQTWEEFLGAGYFCFNAFPAVENVYYQAVSEVGLDPNFYILDRNQQVVYSADPSKMGMDMSGEAYIQQLSQGESRSGRFRIGTQDMMVGYVPIDTVENRQGWMLLTMQSWDEIMQSLIVVCVGWAGSFFHSVGN